MSVSLSPLFLAALQRAAAHPEGMPLVGQRGAGLFQANALGKQAAQECKSLGLLRTVTQRQRGRSVQEICALTDQGWRRLQENAVLDCLYNWAERLADCPLPELYRVLPASTWTIGAFHDVLRALLQQQRIWLHPWTGPLSEIPEPALALLVGHEVAYYASLRR